MPDSSPKKDDAKADQEVAQAAKDAADAAVKETAKAQKAAAKAEAATRFRTITSPTDLRVVTDEKVVFRLEAGVARELPDTLILAAQGVAAKQGIDLVIK